MGSVTFILNGEERTAVYSGRETLLKYLRNVECLKGTKRPAAWDSAAPAASSSMENCVVPV